MSEQAGKPKKSSIKMILLLFLLIGISAGAVYYFMGDQFGSSEKQKKTEPKAEKKITNKIASKSVTASKKIEVAKSSEPADDPISKTTPPDKVESKKIEPVAKTLTAKTETKKAEPVSKSVKLVNFEGDSAEAFKQKIADLENKLAESEKECASAKEDNKKTIDSLTARISQLEKGGKSKNSSASVSGTTPKSGKAVSTRTKKEKRMETGSPVFTAGAKSFQGVPIESYTPPRKTFQQEAPTASYAPRTASYPATSYTPRRKYENDFTETGSYYGGATQSRSASGKTLYDMSVQFGDSYGISSGGLESRYKLAPGVAVFPRKLDSY